MAVTRAQAEQAMRVLQAELSQNGPALAAVLGVERVTFEVGTTVTDETDEAHPYWTATTRRGTTVHRAGPEGFTVDPCRRSMQAGGVRLTRAEVDAIEGHTWCVRCGGRP